MFRVPTSVQGLKVFKQEFIGYYKGTDEDSPKSSMFQTLLLGFGVPYFNTFFFKGTLMKYKFRLFSPWLLKSPATVSAL